jgi:hypothetical protein
MREVEKKITEVKAASYDKLTRPVCAFITFEEEDAYILAQDFEPVVGKKSDVTFLGEDLYFIEATEPTNIIWENRHFTSKDRFTRGIHAVLLISLLVLISFVLIYTVKLVSIKIA